MNKEQAIKMLRHCEAERHCYDGIHGTCKGCNKRIALDMAIEALQTPPISQRSMYQAGYKQGREDVLQDMKEGSIDGCNNKK